MRFRLLRPHHMSLAGVPQLVPAGAVVDIWQHSRVTPFIEPLDAESAAALAAEKQLILQKNREPEIPSIGSRQTLE